MPRRSEVAWASQGKRACLNLSWGECIHVAGISMWWRSSEGSIRDSVSNALGLATEHGFESVAMPLIGAGTGGGGEEAVLRIVEDQLGRVEFSGRVVVVRHDRG
jgi:O-acetyl-ADP-ribose deacetylase (regulator of RNase III)